MKKILFLSILVLAGCESGPDKTDSGMKAKAVFPDVPAHGSMTYVSGIGQANPPLRSYKQIYRGKIQVKHLVRFYRDTMPTHGWKEVSSHGDDPVLTTFQKNREECEVRVETTPSQDTIITVAIGYKG
jgi:hypothetical protein|tara:strand:- start:152 stop:535 length:384 start_codon:yes stop_codon:yes gene_type:complete